MRKSWHAPLGAALLVMAGAPASLAAGPTVAQILALKPSQDDLVYDTPAADQYDKCKLDVLKKPQSGWVLRDHRGLVVRRFLDVNGDNVVDSWAFCMNGQEVYRDIDANFNGKVDQCRWYHVAGSRWGVDENEDGVIDSWKQISAEEASAEAIAAIVTRNYDRLRLVLLSENELRQLGIGADAQARAQRAVSEAPAKFQKITLPRGTQWTRFDGHNPMTVPASDVGGSKDLVVYGNATVLAEGGGQTHWFRVPEVVKVGDVWKLSDVPAAIDPNKASAAEHVLIPNNDTVVVSTGGNEPGEGLVEDSPEVQKYVQSLQALDQTAPSKDGSDLKKLVAYHIKRAELCAHIGAKSKKLKPREHWYKQTADSLNAAAQTGEYAQGVTTLDQYADQFAKTSWGKNLAGYFKYRAINASYALKLADPAGNHQEAQKLFLADLRKFLDAYPENDDIADALWQLGNGSEFSNAEEDAKEFYRKLATKFPKNPAGVKASGALRRLEAVGQPFQLVGTGLGRGAKVDVSAFRGNVILVHFWSTWCEPCKQELPRLAKLRDKYRAQGFELVGVNLDANKAAAENLVRSSNIAWPQIYEEGSMESAPAVQFGIISLPYMMLIDADGRVISKNLQINQLETEVEKAMAKKIASRQD